MNEFDRIFDLIASTRFHFNDEKGLQDGIELLFQQNKVKFEREYELKPRGRIDFFLPSGLGIEVKVKDSPSKVLQQIHGYAQHAEVKQLLLVTSRIKLGRVPETINGKEIRGLALWANGL